MSAGDLLNAANVSRLSLLCPRHSPHGLVGSPEAAVISGPDITRTFFAGFNSCLNLTSSLDGSICLIKSYLPKL